MRYVQNIYSIVLFIVGIIKDVLQLKWVSFMGLCTREFWDGENFLKQLGIKIIPVEKDTSDVSK